MLVSQHDALEHVEDSLGDPQELVKGQHFDSMQVGIQGSEGRLMLGAAIPPRHDSRPYLQRVTAVLTENRVSAPLDLRDGTYAISCAAERCGSAQQFRPVFFGSRAATRYVSWTSTKIKVRVPRLARGGKSVTVRTTGGRSNARTFKVI